jgi:hypothetical protein
MCRRPEYTVNYILYLLTKVNLVYVLYMLSMALCGNETGHFAAAPEEVEGHALNHLITPSIILSWMEEVILMVGFQLVPSSWTIMSS